MVCQSMPYDRTRHLIEGRKEQADKMKMKILDAIRSLETDNGNKNPRPTDIYKYLLQQAKKIVEEHYQNEKITVRGDMKKKLDQESKQETPSIRTIQRKLVELHNEGLIGHTGQRYYLTDLARHDLRTFTKASAQEFGTAAMASIMETHFRSLEPRVNLEHLIKLFGLYVIFIMIEASRPVRIPKEDNPEKFESIESITRDKLAVNWVKNALDPEVMLQFFLVGIIPVSSKQRSASELWLKKFAWNKIVDVYHDYHKKHSNANPDPLYELGHPMVEKLTKLFMKDYSNYYSKLMNARLAFFGRPKEGSLSKYRQRLKGYEMDIDGKETTHYDKVMKQLMK